MALSFSSPFPLHCPEYQICYCYQVRWILSTSLLHSHCHLGATCPDPPYSHFWSIAGLSNPFDSCALNMAYFIICFDIPKRHSLVCSTGTHSGFVIGPQPDCKGLCWQSGSSFSLESRFLLCTRL